MRVNLLEDAKWTKDEEEGQKRMNERGKKQRVQQEEDEDGQRSEINTCITLDSCLSAQVQTFALG